MDRDEGRQKQVFLGIVAIVATVFLMSFTDALVKYVSADFPLWQLYVIRSFMAITILAGIQLFGRRQRGARPKFIAWVTLRSLLLAMMYLAIYAAIPVLELSVIAAALYTAPIFIALLSAWWIGEPVGLRRWLAVIFGFAGVIVILRPGGEAFSLLALIPVIAGLCYALAAIITRSKCADESPMTLSLALNFALLAVGLIATAALAIWQPLEAGGNYPFLFGAWVAVTPEDWIFLTLLATLIVVISIGFAKAYQLGPPVIIATFDYAYLGFAALWGFVLFAEIPDGVTLAGIAMIATAGLIVVAAPK
ncbi:DMT family transporter [Pelagibius sp. Alg239-R121]|uniref:DMT family transporter n=1 Tax=Pelagibius sp. Alg239-R121 TaxID=2993448 RepID=UPI0024A61C9A|nr:DMT family transporter [Pelagibius sp. Alg239-R121]